MSNRSTSGAARITAGRGTDGQRSWRVTKLNKFDKECLHPTGIIRYENTVASYRLALGWAEPMSVLVEGY